jgi:hypothetical protein
VRSGALSGLTSIETFSALTASATKSTVTKSVPPRQARVPPHPADASASESASPAAARPKRPDVDRARVT